MSFHARSAGRTPIDHNSHIVLDHEDLRSVDFSRRRLAQFSAVGSRLRSGRFDNTRIESASFGAGREPSEYIECSFDGSHIRFGPGGYARFVRCSFRNVDLRDWFCFAVELIDCTFTGRLRRAFFNGSVPEDKQAVLHRERNEFRGNDFVDMNLLDVGFRTGIDLTKQRLPTGPSYLFVADATSAVQRARSEVIGWEELEVRQLAIAIIKTLEDAVQGGQQQLLLRAENYSQFPAEVVEAVFSLLRPGQGS
jgi:hypothetical protein